MRRREKLPQPLAVREILTKIFKPADQRALALRCQVRQAWEAAAGEHLAAVTRLVDLKHRVLWVEVPTSAWIQELQFEKHRLLNELANRLAPGTIKDIKFTLAAGQALP